MLELVLQSLTWLGGIQFALIGLLTIRVVRGVHRLIRLRDVDADQNDSWPTISVVLAARNEEEEIRNCIDHLLRQNYPNFGIIAVDDRSNDQTGAILDECAAGEERLSVIHLRELPAGWLGKNCALQHGASQAEGEYILFTDADVIMHPDTMRRGMAIAIANQLDHLTVMPTMKLPGLLTESVLGTLAKIYMLSVEPWRSDPKDLDKFVGIGAFNLVKTSAYRAVGMHEPIRMCPLDDIKLGKILKSAGFRQALASGTEMIEVKWYHSLKEMVRGLEKNTLAMFDYRLRRIGSFLALLILVLATPFVGICLSSGILWWLFAGSILSIFVLMWQVHTCLGLHRRAVLLYPAGIVVIVAIVIRNTWITLRRGGIQWRDTFYSLDQIRAMDC